MDIVKPLCFELRGEGYCEVARPNSYASELLGTPSCAACVAVELVRVRENSTQLAESNAQLAHDNQQKEHAIEIAKIDTVTGLRNRQAFEDEQSHFLERAEPFAVLMADVDGLKRVNEALGDDEGDRLLECVATSLISHLRPGDDVYRYGGDEFVGLMSGVGPLKAEEIIIRCKFIEDAVDIAILEAGFPEDLKVGLSTGIATFSDSGESVRQEAYKIMKERKTYRKRKTGADLLPDDRLLPGRTLS